MKKLSEKSKVSYNSVFYSAYKALAIFKMLCESPKTVNEILDGIKLLPISKSSLSNDTLRAYFKSLEDFGFVIEKRLTHKRHRQYVYSIIDSPFRPKIDELQISRFFEIYEMAMYNSEFDELIELDCLCRKLNVILKNSDFTSAYLKHSLIKNISEEMLYSLSQCCKENSVVTVCYDSPKSGKKNIPIIAHSLIIQNYKPYLKGFGLEYNQEGIFFLERILKIVKIEARESVNVSEESEKKVVYELYNPEIQLESNEKLISEVNDVRTVSLAADNSVLALQRLMQLGCDIKIIAPDNYKKNFISILKAIKGNYSG